MSLEASIRDELRTLVESLFEEQLDGAGHDRLAELLAGSAEAQWLYLREMNLHAGLAWDAGMRRGNDQCARMNDESAAAPPPGAAASAIHPSSFILHPFAWAAGSAVFSYTLAALILGAGLLAAWKWQGPGRGQAAPAGQLAVQMPPAFDMAQAPCVGRVTGMSGCYWADPKSAAELARVLVGRDYLLPEGAMLELAYNVGVNVVLEGPAAYHVQSLNSGFLWFGKATVRAGLKPAGEKPDLARAAVSAPGFWLGAPTLDFVGRGAEFAVAVKKCSAPNSGSAYIEVFRGVLKVRLPSQDGDVMFLDSSAPAYVTVDAKNIRVYYGDKQLSPTIFARHLPKESPVYTKGNERKRSRMKGIGPDIPNS